METNLMKIMNELDVCHTAYNAAVDRRMGISPVKEQLKNMLFNYYEVIISALKDTAAERKEIAELREEYSVLEDALAQADEENKKLKLENEELKNGRKKNGR